MSERPPTDKDRLLALLADFGLHPGTRYVPERYRGEDWVVLYEGEGGVTGYDDYFCAFGFQPDGRFRCVEIRE